MSPTIPLLHDLNRDCCAFSHSLLVSALQQKYCQSTQVSNITAQFKSVFIRIRHPQEKRKRKLRGYRYLN